MLCASIVVGMWQATSQGGTTLTIATHYTDEQRAPLTSCIDEYERLNPGMTIVHRQLSYRDFLQTLFMARIGGAVPDIYNLANMWTAQLVQSGSLAEPSPEISNFVRRNYLTETSGTAIEQQVWGIPAEVNVYMLLYNKLLFAKAGLTRPPATWDQLVHDAAKISRTNRQGQLTVAGFGFGPNPAMVVNPFIALLYSHGETLFSPDRRSTNLTSNSAREVLEGQVRLFRTRGTSLGATPTQFPSGTLGMMIVPNWYKNELLQTLGERFADKVGVAPIPGGTNWRTVQYGFFWAVDTNSRNKTEAWKLLQWLNTPHVPGHRSCVGDMLFRLGALTRNKADLAASADELGHPFMKPFADALSDGRALPLDSIPHSNEIEELLRSYIEEAWLGLLPPDEALRKADIAIGSILRESD
jgi:multiple sugar transport system substrate-binding protein